MKVSVFDTYVRKKDNGIMHFDILVSTVRKNIETIHEYGRHFMESKGQAGQPLTARECQFCHVEEATEKMKKAIKEKG